MAKFNIDSRTIREISAKISDAGQYKIKDHKGEEVTMSGAELKRYMIAFRNQVDFSKLFEEVETTSQETVQAPASESKKSAKKTAEQAQSPE